MTGAASDRRDRRAALAFRLRHAGRALAALVGLVVVYGLVGFLVVPGVVRSQAETAIAEQLGRKATIGAVHVNPFLLAARIDDFRLYEADGRTVFVAIDALDADVSSASLFRRALVFDRLAITRPTVRVVRLAPERFNVSDLVERLAAKPKSDAPAAFSLNNIVLDGGVVDVDDRVAGRRHRVEALHVGLPFLSNLPHDTAIFVTPEFTATVDGSALALRGKAQPFATSREAAVDIDVADIDLAQYADLAPTKLPFRLVAGKLSAKLAVTFRAATVVAGKTTPQSLAIAGHVGLAGLDIAHPSGRHALGAKSIDVDLVRVDPLNGVYALQRVALVAPTIDAVRRADGTFDVVDLFSSPPAAPSTAPPALAKNAQATSPTVTVAAATVTDGRIHVVDETLAKAATADLKDIDLALGAIALGGDRPTSYRMSMATDDGATLQAAGEAVVGKRSVTGTVAVARFEPARVAPWLAGVVAARIDDGSVDGSARYRIDAAGARPAGVVDEIALSIDRLRTTLVDGASTAPLFAAERIALAGGRFDLATRAFDADTLTLTAPVVAVRRDARGRLNLRAAIVEAKPVAVPAAGADASEARATAALVVAPVAARPFTATVRRFAIERGDVAFEDLATPRPVRVRVQPFDFAAENVGTTTTSVMPFKLAATVDQRGKLAVAGRATVAPLSVEATMEASQLPVGAFGAYVGDRLNIVVDNADVSAKGRLDITTAKVAKADGAAGAAPDIAYRGTFGIARMRALDRATSDEFVRWKSLDVSSVDLRVPGGAAPPSVALGTVALDDFYARVIVNANGRLNLQDVVASPGRTQSVTAPESEAAVARPAAPRAAPPTGPKPSIRVAGIRLTKGRIGITDNFIRPNYSATLTDLSGDVAAIASDDPKPAAVRLAGRIDGEGTLDVAGSINPLAATLYTDLAAQAKDIELTRLSPYAVKYAGYGIERGRLSTTVKYHIENGRLTATNRLFLDQLTFGAHDPASQADLPVRLAVALLANARGEIDIELPVSGTLSDPEFSVGGVLWRALVGLVTRAVTSPFSLIGAAFGGGGGGELGYIQFMPGVSDLTPQGRAKLETLAKALAERPALKLDIIGRYDPATDPDGIRRDHLLDRLKDLKAKERSKAGEPVGRDDVTIEPGAERARYVARLYDDTKLPDKPRNALGLAKDIPVDDQERLLLANIALDPNDPRWLAEARADVVRHYIEDTGKIPAGRVFLVAPKLDASGLADDGAPNRVDFALR